MQHIHQWLRFSDVVLKKGLVFVACCATLFVPYATSAAIGATSQDGILPSSGLQNTALPTRHAVNVTNRELLNPASPMPLSDDVMQFKAGRHLMGFKSDRVYLVNTAGFLSVEFMGTRGVMPKATSGRTMGTGHKIRELGRVEYPDLWEGITLSYEGTAGA